jgi:biotin carboxylase
MHNRDIILTINVVEKELVDAVNLHSKLLKKPLKGLALVNKNYAHQPGRPKDTSGLFEEVICDFDNPNEIQRALKPYTERLLAATCRYEEAMQDFGKVIPFLPYIYTPSPTALLCSTEKPIMRNRLKNYDESLVPRYQYMEETDLPNLSTLVKNFQYPVIVKPSGLAKALLVARCDTEEELQKRLEYTFKIIHHAYAREQYPGRPGILVEEMMQGEMYSVDAYVTHDGEIFCLPPVKVITAHALGLPGFYGCERVVPTDLSKEEVQGAFAASKSALRALTLSSTTTHIELIRTAQGWKIIEVAARIGGYRDALYRESYGIEHFYNDLSVRMGKKPKMPTKPVGHAVALNIYAESEGYIESIEGIEEAKAIPSVRELNVLAGKGDVALFSHNGGDALITALLSNKDPEQLQRDSVAVRELIKITVKRKKGYKKELNFTAVDHL